MAELKKIVPSTAESAAPSEQISQQAQEQQTAAARDKLLTSTSDAQRILLPILQSVLSKCVAGAQIGPICVEADDQILQQTSKLYKKSTNGIAFPTCISINNQVSNVSPLPSDTEFATKLAAGDLVKVQLGVHVDGHASVTAETIVVPVADNSSTTTSDTSKQSKVINCANTVAEVVIRSLRPGVSNAKIAANIASVATDYGCHALSGQVSSSTVQGKFNTLKRLSITPPGEQHAIEVGDVWIIDLLLSTSPAGTKCAKGETRTCVFNKTGSAYQLKSAVARKAFSQLRQGEWPFSLRGLEDELKGRFAMSECERSGVITPFDVLYDKAGEYVAQVTFTVFVGETHNTRLSPIPTWSQSPEAKSLLSSTQVSLSNSELADLLKQPLKPNKKKAAAAKAPETDASKASA